ncbi:TolC family protein [Novosphingobium sp. FKTRR1]|uniref:TolC family protein n=1 Tax=Novosphingobium sp. FKTRR1 TaxID=2879118 RepID=UPI001CEFBAD2|nr:TolC family protein [Novosphingobium sp. FKTRR1]
MIRATHAIGAWLVPALLVIVGGTSALAAHRPGATPRSLLDAPARDPLAVKCAGTPRSSCRLISELRDGFTMKQQTAEPEPEPTETLAQALDSAYRTAPTLQAQRYQLQALDENYAQALAELRPSASIQVVGNYSQSVFGRTSQANRPFTRSSILTDNSLAATASVTQPLLTGGRAAADREAALALTGAGREELRGAEGDLLLAVITAYADVRRDGAVLRLYADNLAQLQAMLAEVKARKDAGELTRTDIAQAETQLQLVQAAFNATVQQQEQDRARFALLVGHDPGVLAPPPPLPMLPETLNDAFDNADRLNPELSAAIASERQSRAQIAAARAARSPTLSLGASATLTGKAVPFYSRNDDQVFQGQAVLTIPLTTGGRVSSQIAQAEDRNSAARLGIESARRRVVAGIVAAWNAVATLGRNVTVGVAQSESARVFDEGSFAEYRAGLRSTFDVLYAHATRRDTEILLIDNRRDLYVAQATLLRQTGQMEARQLMTGSGLYAPADNFVRAAERNALPWDGIVRAVDGVNTANTATGTLAQPAIGHGPAAIVAPTAEHEPAAMPIATHSPSVPRPGTSGIPQSGQMDQRR